jgi:hypothetical protein
MLENPDPAKRRPMFASKRVEQFERAIPAVALEETDREILAWKAQRQQALEISTMTAYPNGSAPEAQDGPVVISRARKNTG